MSYNGRVWNTHPDGFQLDERTIDIEIPKEVMEELYIPIDGKVYISDNGNFTARMKLDNSLGGRELKLGLRVNGQDTATDWWENGRTVQRTIRNAPNDVLSYIGLGLADDQIRIKFTVDASTWSAVLEKITVT